MNTQLRRQSGFYVIEVILIIAVVAVLGFVVWMFITKKSPSQALNGITGNSNGLVEWDFNGDSWKAMGKAPECENPLTIASPVDVTKVNSVLLPGEVRGGDFKPHGGLGGDPSTNNMITVSAIRDAYLYRGSRYLVEGQVQYMFDFMDSCGVMYRLDHLATLTPEFQAYADKLPQPQPDDSRTEKFRDHPLIKKGTMIATEVGIRQGKNVFFDLGVYDLRQPNDASKTDLYKTDQLRIQDKEQSFYALCWFDYLTGSDKTAIKALPVRNGQPAGTSDYCK
ncbi:hypothetical protein EPO04_00155 [Patescibacteria group bacterium]|nr:MAG: hypothetical protein EPO04_00155 [Patescibacteria group bacterium]